MHLPTLLFRIFASALLILLLVAAFAACIAAETVRGGILEPSTYTGSLDEVDAYERVYSEFLTTVEERETTEQLLAYTDVSAEDTEAMVRAILPPGHLQREVERNVEHALAYLRGDTGALDLSIDLRPVLENMGPVLSDYLQARIAALPMEPVTDYETFLVEMDAAVATVREGHDPAVLPSYPLNEAERLETLSLVFPEARDVDTATLEALDDALAAGDTRAALSLVIDDLLARRLDDALAEIRAELQPGDRLDFVAQMAEDEGRTRDEVLDDWAAVRRNVSRFTTWARPLTFIALALTIAGLALVQLPSRRRALATVSVACLSLALAGSVVWWLHHDVAPSMVRNAIIERQSETSVALTRIAADAAEAAVRRTASAYLVPLALMAGLGTAAGLGALVSGRRPAGDGAPAGTGDEDGDSGDLAA